MTTCDWLVERRVVVTDAMVEDGWSPDFPSDLVEEVECGLPVVPHPDYPEGTTCTAGHDRLPIEISLAPYGPEWRREQEERLAWERGER